MKIFIAESSTGFVVQLVAEGRSRFDWLLNDFKQSIPRRCRRFSDGRWLVERRVARTLNAWLAVMYEAGAEIVREAGSPGPGNELLTNLYAELFLMPGAPVALVEAARSVLAVDRDEEQMKRVNVAADLILQIERCRRPAA